METAQSPPTPRLSSETSLPANRRPATDRDDRPHLGLSGSCSVLSVPLSSSSLQLRPGGAGQRDGMSSMFAFCPEAPLCPSPVCTDFRDGLSVFRTPELGLQSDLPRRVETLGRPGTCCAGFCTAPGFLLPRPPPRLVVLAEGTPTGPESTLGARPVSGDDVSLAAGGAAPAGGGHGLPTHCPLLPLLQVGSTRFPQSLTTDVSVANFRRFFFLT